MSGRSMPILPYFALVQNGANPFILLDNVKPPFSKCLTWAHKTRLQLLPLNYERFNNPDPRKRNGPTTFDLHLQLVARAARSLSCREANAKAERSHRVVGRLQVAGDFAIEA
jgi:hypothetical protein